MDILPFSGRGGESSGLSAAEVLKAAADLIAQPGAWTRNRNARNLAGSMVPSTSDHAVCWCTLGAIERVARYDLNAKYAAINALTSVLDSTITKWNDADGRTQAEAVAMLRETAALLPANQGGDK